MDRCSAISRRASTVTQGGKCHHSEHPLFLLLPPDLHGATWAGISPGSVGISCPSFVPSQSLVPPLLLGWGEEQEGPWLCAGPAQPELKYPCITCAVSSTNPKHSPILTIWFANQSSNSMHANNCPTSLQRLKS